MAKGAIGARSSTSRVEAILEALADGHTLREIAEHLRLSRTAVAKGSRSASNAVWSASSGTTTSVR
jgi:DNA-binding NarL/FixJ family response regulator